MEQTNENSSAVRRRREQMLELLSAFDKSQGLSVKSFCKLHQISEASFYSARKRYRAVTSAAKVSSGFIALTQAVMKDPSGALFAEVGGIKLYRPVPADYLKALVL